jgi:hypothetical protein
MNSSATLKFHGRQAFFNRFVVSRRKIAMCTGRSTSADNGTDYRNCVVLQYILVRPVRVTQKRNALVENNILRSQSSLRRAGMTTKQKDWTRFWYETCSSSGRSFRLDVSEIDQSIRASHHLLLFTSNSFVLHIFSSVCVVTSVGGRSFMFPQFVWDLTVIGLDALQHPKAKNSLPFARTDWDWRRGSLGFSSASPTGSLLGATARASDLSPSFQ